MKPQFNLQTMCFFEMFVTAVCVFLKKVEMPDELLLFLQILASGYSGCTFNKKDCYC